MSEPDRPDREQYQPVGGVCLVGDRNGRTPHEGEWVLATDETEIEAWNRTPQVCVHCGCLFMPEQW